MSYAKMISTSAWEVTWLICSSSTFWSPFVLKIAAGRCGYGKFGATINGGHVSAASDLYRDGVGCGACYEVKNYLKENKYGTLLREQWFIPKSCFYQVRCTNINYCSDKGVTAVVTDHGSSDRTDFILSRRAFGRMAQNADAAVSLLALGVVDIEYRR